MTPEAVAQVIARIRGGEVDAFAELVQAFQRDVWKVAAFALQDRDETEDLVQRCFLTAYTKLDRFEPGTNFKAWLKTIARNLMLEELRQRARDQRRLRSYQSYLEMRLADDDDAESYEEELREALHHCREALSPAANQAIELRYEQQFSFAKVAEQLDRTVAASRQLLQRARLNLRLCIAERMS